MKPIIDSVLYFMFETVLNVQFILAECETELKVQFISAECTISIGRKTHSLSGFYITSKFVLQLLIYSHRPIK